MKRGRAAFWCLLALGAGSCGDDDESGGGDVGAGDTMDAVDTVDAADAVPGDAVDTADTEPSDTSEPPDTADAEDSADTDDANDAGDTVDGSETVVEKVYRAATPFFEITANLNPTAEYYGFGWGLFSNLLLRTLVGHRHVAGAAGNELVPDLATDLGTASADRMTYTFHLKPGVRFGPPVDRAITSRDVLYAFRRIATAALSDYGPGFYYHGLIVGMDGPLDEMPDGIAGIETPDDATIVFHLTRPDAAFLYLLAMPAAAPVPEEVAGCFAEGAAYGAHLVASGPYMIEGSDAVDASSCAGLLPLSGFDSEAGLVLVKNPAYDAATDDPEARETDIDRFEILRRDGDLYDALAEGRLESVLDPAPPEAIADPRLRDRVYSHPLEVIFYVGMNLTQPPFDDVHVRKAVNLIVDKAAVLAALAGVFTGEPATHVLPPPLTGGHPTAAELDPFSQGGLDAAKAEMRLSPYDGDGDGICDADVCRDVRHLVREDYHWPLAGAVLDDALALIGIELATEVVGADVMYGTGWDAQSGLPISTGTGWGKDFAEPGSFLLPLFHSSGIGSCCNTPMVGLTPEIAAALGVPGNTEGVPSVDADIDACLVTLDDAARMDCWRALDRKLTGDIVPWLPLFWRTYIDIAGPALIRRDFDQFSLFPAFAHVDVDPRLQAETPPGHTMSDAAGCRYTALPPQRVDEGGIDSVVGHASWTCPPGVNASFEWGVRVFVPEQGEREWTFDFADACDRTATGPLRCIGDDAAHEVVSAPIPLWAGPRLARYTTAVRIADWGVLQSNERIEIVGAAEE